MKIGIYGGTFNPIHKGHTSLAKYLVRKGYVDEVWIMVSPQNPLKNNNDAVNFEDRIQMARIATRRIKGVVVSDFEGHLPIPSYTISTLNALSQEYPQHTFSLIIGADNWERFSKWYKADEIKENYDIIVYQRPGCEKIELPSCHLSNTTSHTVIPINNKLYDISSTEVRQRVFNNQPLDKMINKDVETYIHKHSLYTTNLFK